MNSIAIGLVGTGNIARTMVSAFRDAGGTNIVAVCSNSTERAEAFALEHNIDTAYSDLETMLADSRIGALYIGNATFEHAKVAISALNAGKHVLCEKPFAMTAEEGRKVIVAAQQSGRLFMEGLWTHFLPAYQQAYSVLDSGDLGEPVHLVADFGYRTTKEDMPQLYLANGGGVLLDRAIYPISMALKVLGPIKSLQSDIVKNTDGIDVHVNISMAHQSGAHSNLMASLITNLSNTASITCSEGNISLMPPVIGAEVLKIEKFAPNNSSPNRGGKSGLKSLLKQSSMLRSLKSKLGGGKRFSYGKNQYSHQIRHFLNLIAENKTESDVVSHQLSLDILQVLDQVRGDEI